ncbi:MAG: endonuclease III [Elusimicrobiaceae bacterium]|jgi:endonuclease III|nr:endonuclease III [Elusimicrobiaceae bacterium]MBT3955302.1 endonuclease III [Elusimicrobiaceae bacterium]MBT4008438.1 endonuclease III [Elusimicrobiaceae bacterium]MBT4403247.1 endonuclease III [Elusimicrobiaceae bacterium]MBT4440167.1 endonuclease III [Elusimicrobiaceae bacterium]
MLKKYKEIIKILQKHYPEVDCALTHKNAYELLMSVILSAQCTDVRVNKTTPILFKKYPTVESMAEAKIFDVEKIVKPTGFYKNKSKSLIESSKKIIKNFGGEVPNSMEKLLTLRGVARKTANVVLGNWYKKSEGVVVDTHVKRLAFRMGLTKNRTPEKVEKDLMKLLPKTKWIWISHALIWHGRKICNARKPKCAICPLDKTCLKNDVLA